ncbi:hypothetical protein BT69DRAFT_489696 [Atractiella rhizophila]|nr:hypothetical protein BT69DRAFT_489696 [Atractiella rhizophila]
MSYVLTVLICARAACLLLCLARTRHDHSISKAQVSRHDALILRHSPIDVW